MADVYVYRFTQRDSEAGITTVSARWATLETIRGNGEPITESQIVVHHTELDANGFLVRFGDASHEIDNLWAQIRSLKLRAASRDAEALQLNESTEAERKYVLGVESRELRDRAQTLTGHRTKLISDEFGRAISRGAYA
ncbi:MAG: hypothetical protein ACLPV8_18410 [Steroidobacteraceae bacterium]